MTASLFELVCSLLFLVFANGCTIFAFMTEDKRLRAICGAVALLDRLFVRSFRPRRDGKAASRPVMRIAS
ncbi:hypothetical protein I6F35_15520 [Bradyrhizobium sp. BRP22]|uniref:hypothetical protein n=1 Tax=Bradyrhizobium sp. BRP22 TaxID=2793821 RepID=UPI001CD5056B|nr:hypothetical protein [Bradyrhizobium sp. BRP22]MCA1454619.1 hypothetical protein [Bradyrhizobium sp. BRP22]